MELLVSAAAASVKNAPVFFTRTSFFLFFFCLGFFTSITGEQNVTNTHTEIYTVGLKAHMVGRTAWQRVCVSVCVFPINILHFVPPHPPPSISGTLTSGLNERSAVIIISVNAHYLLLHISARRSLLAASASGRLEQVGGVCDGGVNTPIGGERNRLRLFG